MLNLQKVATSTYNCECNKFSGCRKSNEIMDVIVLWQLNTIHTTTKRITKYNIIKYNQ